MVEESPNRLVIGLPSRPKVWGGILLLAALAAGLVAIRVGTIGIIIALLCGGWGLWLITRCRSATFDAVRRNAVFVTNHLLFGRKRESIPFTSIVEIYLDYSEETCTGGEGAIWIERKWNIFLRLRDGRTLTVARLATPHAVEDSSSLVEQSAYWEELAARISTLTGKTLVRTPTVPGGPHTFVEAIDQILQNRMTETQFSDRSVHLRSGKSGGLEIVVSGAVYSELDEIEDEAVRNLIQSSLDEWQNTNDMRGMESMSTEATRP